MQTTTKQSTLQFQPFFEAYEPLKVSELPAKKLAKRILTKSTSAKHRIYCDDLRFKLALGGYPLPKYRVYKIIRTLREEGSNIIADRNGMCITKSKSLTNAYLSKLNKVSNSYSKLRNTMIANINK